MEQSKASPYRSYQGGYFKTLIDPEQSDNALALLELTLPKGAEPPPHIHTREDESFYVVAGKLSVQVADTTYILEPGDAIFAPRGVPHSFRILTETATILNLISPGMLWNYFIAFSAQIEGVPAMPAAPVKPPADAIRQMLDTISNEYKVRFV